MSYPKTIAVDFDGTLCEDAYPNIGPPRLAVIRNAIEEKRKGTALILWTCRTGEYLKRALDWCASYGLIFDEINANITERVAAFGADPRKVSADAYWDDRATASVGKKTDFVMEYGGFVRRKGSESLELMFKTEISANLAAVRAREAAIRLNETRNRIYDTSKIYVLERRIVREFGEWEQAEVDEELLEKLKGEK